MTIAQQLNVKDFPFEIKDKNGHRIYYEDSNGFWQKSEYFDNRLVYYKSSEGTILDIRHKVELTLKNK